MTKITISNQHEEASCDWCGGPLYVGDTAVLSASGIFCGDGCHKQFQDRQYRLGEERNAIATGCYHP